MQVTEENGIRYYIDDVGKRYRSVTGILSATKPDRDVKSIQNWRMKKGEDAADLVFNNACLRGSATHSAAESFLKGEDVVIDYLPALPYWESLRKGLTPIGEVIMQEEMVSHQIGYAGRFDLFGEYRGIPNTIVDFKTSDRPKRPEYINDYKMQLAAYAGGIKSTFGYDVDQGVLIIGIANRQPQTVVLNKTELLFYWKLWVQRVNQYHKMQAEKSIYNLEAA